MTQDDDDRLVPDVDQLTWSLIHGMATGKQATDEAATALAQIGSLGAGHLALLALTGHGALLLQRLATATGRSIDDLAATIVELNTFTALVCDIDSDRDG